MSEVSTPQEYPSDHEETENIEKENLEDILDLWSEKRSSSREQALKKFIRFLRLSVVEEDIQTNFETISENIKKSLKKGTSKEKELASLAFSLVCITIGDQSEPLFKEVDPILQEIILNSKDENLNSSCIDSLAISSFVVNSSESITNSIIDLLYKKFKGETGKVVTSALKGWSLLLTDISSQKAYTMLMKDIRELSEFLKDENVDVRVVAGECIALAVEIGREVEEEDFDIYNFSGETDIDELLDTLHEMSQDKSKQRGKKEKGKQKVNFNLITNYIQEEEPPKEVLSFKQKRYIFDSWAGIRQLNCFRDCLGIGLQIHFENNALIDDIFGGYLDEEPVNVQLTAVEKRKYLSPHSFSSKFRTKTRGKQRKNKYQEFVLKDSD